MFLWTQTCVRCMRSAKQLHRKNCPLHFACTRETDACSGVVGGALRSFGDGQGKEQEKGATSFHVHSPLFSEGVQSVALAFFDHSHTRQAAAAAMAIGLFRSARHTQ